MLNKEVHFCIHLLHNITNERIQRAGCSGEAHSWDTFCYMIGLEILAGGSRVHVQMLVMLGLSL